MKNQRVGYHTETRTNWKDYSILVKVCDFDESLCWVYFFLMTEIPYHLQKFKLQTAVSVVLGITIIGI